MNTELLTAKELAAALKRDISYVRAMVKLGFKMIGGRCTIASAFEFLQFHPHPRQELITMQRNAIECNDKQVANAP